MSETSDIQRDENVTIPREEYDRLTHIEERFDELAQRVSQIEARQQRDEGVTVTVESDDDGQPHPLRDIQINGYPLGNYVYHTRQEAESNTEAIDGLQRDEDVTEADSEALLPIQRLARTATSDPDQLTANKRRAGLVWSQVASLWQERRDVWIFDSDHIASYLAGRDERNDRRTVGRVIDVIVDGGDDIISRDSGPSGRTLVIVDKSGLREQIDALAGEEGAQEGSK